jgi:rhodanese-related sulfurtransferase
MKRIEVAEARRRLHAGGEIALLDLREAGQFGEGHALFATPCAYSKLELVVNDLVPRKSAPILLIDGGDGISQKAAAILQEEGYSDVSLIDGGMPGWVSAGFPVYKGVNVPSKLLGELVEEAWHPAMISAEELAEWKSQGRSFQFYDARPPEEYAKMRIPGARCLPNGELAHRLPAVAQDGVPIVVTCAGRTRGIIGAVGLGIASGHTEVYALRNGTQGWTLAGEVLERGNWAEPFPELSGDAMRASRSGAAEVIARFDLETVGAADLEAQLEETDATTYLLDVRSAEEAAADPLEGAVHALSGQLVQATDQWVAVRHSRLVLLDDGGMRAALAAFWLRQLGYRPLIAVIDEAIRSVLANRARRLPRKREAPAPLPVIDAVCARYRAAMGTASFVDLRSSLSYRKGHVQGASWLVRPRASALAPDIGGRSVLLIADDPKLAALAATELREAGACEILLVEGGHDALARTGAPIVETTAEPSDDMAIDHLLFVHDRHDGNLESARRYLAWETGLIAQMDDAERAEYSLVHPPA